jgi:capsular polysaccharide biosynthesis protein
MSYEEQVAIFANADVILAPHGAGLTNLTFCKPSTKVIEIFNTKFKGQVHAFYFRISSNVNLDYYLMFGDPIESNNLDMTVVIEKLEKTFDLLLNNAGFS